MVTKNDVDRATAGFKAAFEKATPEFVEARSKAMRDKLASGNSQEQRKVLETGSQKMGNHNASAPQFHKPYVQAWNKPS